MPDSVFITTYQPRRSEIQPWNSSYFIKFEKWIVMAKFCHLSCELIPYSFVFPQSISTFDVLVNLGYLGYPHIDFEVKIVRGLTIDFLTRYDFWSGVGCFCIEHLPCSVSFWWMLGDGNVEVWLKKYSILVHRRS